MNVPVGPTTKGGVGAAALAFASAAIVYLTGDHTAQSVTAVELAGGGLALTVIVMVGRYAQSILHKVHIDLPVGDPAAGDPAGPAPGVETDPDVLRQADVPD